MIIKRIGIPIIQIAISIDNNEKISFLYLLAKFFKYFMQVSFTVNVLLIYITF